MSNYAWLCEYSNYSVTKVHGIQATIPECWDAVDLFRLEQKEKAGNATDDEKQKIKMYYDLTKPFSEKWKGGEFIEGKYMPKAIFSEPNFNEPNRVLPNTNEVMFRIVGGFLIISEKIYKIISKYNLGKTHFSQVYIYDIETKEQLFDKPYYFMNIAEKFEFLDVANSQEITANHYFSQQRKRWIREPKDDDIVLLSQAKANEVDLWHDPLLNHSLFFSDRLAQSLVQSGFNKKELGLIRCVIQ
ncbi:imm11 family protein [Moraxella sp. ZY210820]|uniref:imm11 family protein n=1 Tax=unclassified Moraxella TaxID=2685852 RepID=UPI002730EE9E|nr:DUF1629 domain-containing protein [Moraxella sp. ZY210820]WLF84949.1 hypothetical protein LU301_05660 [Moraxella sp. ZY210820]